MDHFFLESFNSSRITSLIVSFLRVNLRSLKAWYTSLVTRIWGNSDLGSPFFPGIGNHFFGPFGFSKFIIFSRIASMMNSERLRYAYSGCSRINSSTLSRRVSGTLTVVYEVAINNKYITPQITLGSNVDVMHSNNFIGGVC